MITWQFQSDARAAADRQVDAAIRLYGLETRDLWSRRHCSAARDELVRRFLPLARRLAVRYRSQNEPLEDLVQVASLGLLRSIDRFDPDRGVAFSSFAVPTILGELKRHFRDTGWAVRVPRGTQELALRVESAARQMAEDVGRSPQLDELATFMGATIEDVIDGLQASDARYGISLDTPIPNSHPDAETVADTLGGIDDHFALVDTKIDLAAGMRRLPHLERMAFELRVRHGLKQTEIAQRLGCSQMQVSRLLARATGRLRGTLAGTDGPAP